MNIRLSDRGSLRASLSSEKYRAKRFLRSADATLNLSELPHGSSLRGRRDELSGRSVLLLIKDQLTAALALIELDGIVRRLVLYPPDLTVEQIPSVMATASVDAIVSDRSAPEIGISSIDCFVGCSPQIVSAGPDRLDRYETEWILLTSGTTGLPKLVLHTLSTLTAPIKTASPSANPTTWSTFYDIRRYGGVQIFLRAILGGASLVLKSAEESIGDFLVRVGAHGATHISGTPSHWRRVLMSPLACKIAPRYVRLSGEIADQSILDHLQAVYPEAAVAHAFASTEAGVAFEVGDGLSGFPASLIGQQAGNVEMKVEQGLLRIRSAATARGYLGVEKTMADEAGYVDTGDVVELHNHRYYFVGREDGVINVGGRKVHPEEVEVVINRHPRVEMSLVKARKNPIVGAVVVADVVLRSESGTATATTQRDTLQSEILEACHTALAAHKVPAAIRFVRSLVVTPAGKLARPLA